MVRLWSSLGFFGRKLEFSRQYSLRSNIVSLLPTTHRRYTHMAPLSWIPNTYPPARRSEHYDTWKSEKNGQVKVHDPYEWLESHSDETEKWELQWLFFFVTVC